MNTTRAYDDVAVSVAVRIWIAGIGAQPHFLDGAQAIVIGVIIISLAVVTGWEPLRRVADFIRDFWSTELA